MDRNKPERLFCRLAQKAICAAILVLCSAHKPLEIRVIEGGGRYRPYSGRWLHVNDCGYVESERVHSILESFPNLREADFHSHRGDRRVLEAAS
ncbi:hypothetical protein CPC16_005078 [Podila verticillata]|nr:hypothetical protein CPC16_005078 [Podila verticillata]